MWAHVPAIETGITLLYSFFDALIFIIFTGIIIIIIIHNHHFARMISRDK